MNAFTCSAAFAVGECVQQCASLCRISCRFPTLTLSLNQESLYPQMK
jgi:hypothetical protein